MNTPLLLYIFIAFAMGAGISLASIALGSYLAFLFYRSPNEKLLPRKPDGDAWVYDPYEIPDPVKRENVISSDDDLPEPLLSEDFMNRNAQFLDQLGAEVKGVETKE